MSELIKYSENSADTVLLKSDELEVIQKSLAEIGVRFERWQADRPITPEMGSDEIMDAYQSEIEQLKAQEGYVTVDVVSLSADHPEKAAFRAKFLSEHTHGEDEVRFFVAGSGMFYLHVEGFVYQVLCCQNDLISVPANTTHWFDMGPEPSFTAIRLFNNPEGWVAKFTGSDIAERFPLYQ